MEHFVALFAYKLQLSVTVTIFRDNLVYVVGVVDGWGFLFNFLVFPLFFLSYYILLRISQLLWRDSVSV